MNHEHNLRAGFARADITPRAPALNYRNRLIKLPPPSEPQLECVSAVFEDGERTVALTAVDALCISRDMVLRIREEATQKLSRDLSGLMVAATHSHCRGLHLPIQSQK